MLDPVYFCHHFFFICFTPKNSSHLYKKNPDTGMDFQDQAKSTKNALIQNH
jgi:hypothetical protein